MTRYKFTGVIDNQGHLTSQSADRIRYIPNVILRRLGKFSESDLSTGLQHDVEIIFCGYLPYGSRPSYLKTPYHGYVKERIVGIEKIRILP